MYINRKKEKDLGVVIQDNLSPEKHLDRIFGNTFMLINIQMAFHFLDKDRMRKIRTSMITTKLEEKTCIEMQLITLEERRVRGDLITLYKLI